ncbi:MAG: hypothetical protein Q8O67_12825 [Deltaproteobacteria bacterium]|nr:hypothetical protein [Deltaproteobacteria bacterium]
MRRTAAIGDEGAPGDGDGGGDGDGDDDGDDVRNSGTEVHR